MVVIAEFTLPATEFAFGSVLTTEPAMQIELERIVPAGESVMPFFWVSGTGNFEEFVQQVERDPYVLRLRELAHLDGRALYEVVWNTQVADLLTIIEDTKGVILEASGTDTWRFRLRFFAHEDMRNFQNAVREQNIPIQLKRVFTLRRDFTEEDLSALTSKQREALVLAVEQGYFEIPRRTTIGWLADQTGISQQAFSQRLRRGLDTVLNETLL